MTEAERVLELPMYKGSIEGWIKDESNILGLMRVLQAPVNTFIDGDFHRIPDNPSEPHKRCVLGHFSNVGKPRRKGICMPDHSSEIAVEFDYMVVVYGL